MQPILDRPVAVARIRGGSLAPDLTGEALFYRRPSGVLISVQVWGLPSDNPSGFFALHIHAGESCTGDNFADTGTHYNPTNAPHPRHAGDLPPLLSCEGFARACVLTDRFTIEEIIGRTLVIHSGPDDFTTQPAGNAGTKIACGRITAVQR